MPHSKHPVCVLCRTPIRPRSAVEMTKFSTYSGVSEDGGWILEAGPVLFRHSKCEKARPLPPSMGDEK